MQERIENRNLIEIRPLTSPRSLQAKLPVSEAAAATVLAGRHAIRDVIHGRDGRRLVVIVGPCSIHDADAALEYGARLRRVADSVGEQLVLVMRTYFEKPRTTVGWKGLINDPDLDGSCQVERGLEIARRLLLDLGTLGVPCASEVLDPFTPQFVGDLLAWASIGARTSESQTHRQLASGLSMPVGFKNGTNGNLAVAHNALVAAGCAHSFLGITREGDAAVVRTRGNPDRHLVLRGGGGRSNYAPEDVARAATLVAGEGGERQVMIDCSHGNSNKDHTRQAVVCREVLGQVRQGDRAIMGLLLESNLRPGRQAWERGAPLQRGVSITDACMGWEETERLLSEIAEAVAAAAPSGLGNRQLRRPSGRQAPPQPTSMQGR
jgi:3-deoxy-7-phosphoheptulonate synthase